MTDDRWLTVEEIAGALSVHVQTVRRWIKQDGLPAILLGRKGGYRVKASDLDAFLAARAANMGKAAA